MEKINIDNEKYVYYSPHPENYCYNGLHVLRAGETHPNPNYYHERRANFREKSHGVYVMEYVISGRGYIECEGKTYTVEAGDFYFLTRFHAHRYYADSLQPFHKIWVNLSGPFIASLAEVLNLTEGVYIRHFDSPRDILRIHSMLKSYNISPKSHIIDNVALAVTELLLSINSSRKEQRIAISPIILEIKNYIDNEIDIGATLDEICFRFSVNKSYAIASFKKEFGITLYQYMLDKKIRTAKRMLESGMRINDIATHLGYSCAQSFTHAFKTATGVSPNHYRDTKQDGINAYTLTED